MNASYCRELYGNVPHCDYGEMTVVPVEYQGILFLTFVIVAFCVVIYGFIRIATDETVGKP
jgi:hypothetical protein